MFVVCLEWTNSPTSSRLRSKNGSVLNHDLTQKQKNHETQKY